MAYSHTVELVQGDRLPQLTIHLKDRNAAAPGFVLDPDDSATWAPIDISGSTVRMYIRVTGEAGLKDTLVGVPVDPANGAATFLFGEDTLDTPGLFDAEVEVTNADGLKQTVFDLLRFKVREQVG